MANGTIEQRLNGLIPGKQYKLSFEYALNSGAITNPTIRLTVGNVLDKTIEASNKGNVSDWLKKTYTFTANQT